MHVHGASYMRARVQDVVMALGALIVTLAAMPAPAPARPSHSPSVSLSVPAAATSGERLRAVGTARRAPRDARVVLQRRKAGRWATLRRAALRRGRFTFEFKAPASTAGLTLRMRVVLVAGRRQLKRSATRRIPVRAARRIGVAAEPQPVFPVEAQPVAPLQSQPDVAPPPLIPAPPPGDIAATASAVRVLPGGTADVALPSPLTSVTELDTSPAGAAPGVSVHSAEGNLVVTASRQAALAEWAATISGTGCTASGCGRRFALGLPVSVVPTFAPIGWWDEFGGSELDRSRWGYRSSGPRFDATVTPEAVSVAGGALTIKTFTEEGEHYTGMISSYPYESTGFEQTYGYFEARVKFNSAPGQWSAFWLQSPTLGSPLGDPATAGVEMDIAEHRTRCVSAPAPTPPETCAPGNDVADRIQQALIWEGYGPESKSAVKLSDPLPGLDNGSWHTWAVRWAPTDLTFYYDGVPTWSTDGPISRRDQHVILSSEVGEFFAGPIPAEGYGPRAQTTTHMQVDYVRVWPLE